MSVVVFKHSAIWIIYISITLRPQEMMVIVEQEPRTVIHVKRAKMFDPVG